MEDLSLWLGNLASKIWLRAAGPAGMRLLAPALAVAIMLAGRPLWERTGRSPLGRAVRWWCAAVPVALVLAGAIYLYAAPPDDPEAAAALQAAMAERAGRSVMPPQLAAMGALAAGGALLVAGWAWRQARQSAQELAQLAAEWQAVRRRWVRRALLAGAPVATVALGACAAAAVGRPQVPAIAPGESQGVLWVGTAAGVNRLVQGPGGPRWEAFVRPRAPLPASRVTGIAAVTPDEAWIATRGGVAGYLARDGRAEWEITTAETGELPAPIVLAIAVDRRGVVWAATSAGAAAFDRRGPRHAFTSRNAPLLHQILDAVYVDGEGLVWFGGAGGVNVYQPPGPGGDGGSWLVGFTRTSTAGALPDDLVFTISGDSKGRIWFGTAGGAAALAPDRAAFGLGAYDASRWQTFTAERAPLASPHVHAIVEDRQGRIWLGTERGIRVLDESQPPGSPTRWQHFDAGSAPAGGRGLPHPWVQALAVGPDGRVWAGTRGGLAVYDPASPARGWLTYGAHPLRRWTGYLWPAHWQQNILANEVTALVWSR